MVKATRLSEFVRGAHRFILYFKPAIESSPLQIYVSPLVFTPVRILIRKSLEQIESKWITAKPAVEDDWKRLRHDTRGPQRHCYLGGLLA